MSNILHLLLYVLDDLDYLGIYYLETTTDIFPNDSWKYYHEPDVAVKLGHLIPDGWEVKRIEEITGQFYPAT